MRTERLFNDNWEFVKLEIGTGLQDACKSTGWKGVTLPHDWLIYDTKDLYGGTAKRFLLQRRAGNVI